MNYFLLPHSFPFQYKKLDFYKPDADLEPTENSSLSTYLYEIKEKIKELDVEWDIYREYTNPYEYIHTRPPNRQPVAQYKPLSRSYFKMVEIIQHFQMLSPYKNRSIRSFHLAEGPGGFIEALVNMRGRAPNNPWAWEDQYYGMTLLNEQDKTVPSWKKSQIFLKSHPNVTIEYGRDGTGNLLSVENFVGCVEKYGGKMDFITGDGGFDFPEDHNLQETNIYPLLVAQICFAVCLQKKGGCFVMKIYDCFMTSTVELIYLLTSFYEKVYITKPRTSRFANSEKYLVCTNFHFDKTREGEYYSYMLKWLKGIQHAPLTRIFRFPIPRYFMLKLEEYNMMLGQQQIETIFSTISLMDSLNRKNKIDHLIRFHLNKCIQWCQQHGEPITTYSPSIHG